MKWNKIRKLYPDSFVLLREQKSHIEGSIRYIDDVELIKSFADSIEAVTEMIKFGDKVFVYHTSSEKLGFLMQRKKELYKARV